MKVGLFDSGVGGLSVLREIRGLDPGLPLLYVADQAHVPYGPRPLAEVRAYSVDITRWLLAQGSGVVVLACNTASAAALYHLRERFPATPFVGLEPAVKPAAETTRRGVVGVLATPATFEGELYASVVGRFANGITVLEDTCPGLVAEIENGRGEGPAARDILERALRPMLARGVDTVVLGCTHYPFVIPLIRAIAGPGVQVIDPAPAVARQVLRVVRELAPSRAHAASERAAGDVRLVTTGDPAAFAPLAARLLGTGYPVTSARWAGGKLE